MDVCEVCKKPLNKCFTTWVACGKLFCSDLCCARYLLSVYAEEVNTQDIGIPYEDQEPTDLQPTHEDTYRRVLDDRCVCEETVIIRKEDEHEPYQNVQAVW